jgi:hypothetical protein
MKRKERKYDERKIVVYSTLLRIEGAKKDHSAKAKHKVKNYAGCPVVLGVKNGQSNLGLGLVPFLFSQHVGH